jgi:hypothetical protein
LQMIGWIMMSKSVNHSIFLSSEPGFYMILWSFIKTLPKKHFKSIADIPHSPMMSHVPTSCLVPSPTPFSQVADGIGTPRLAAVT